MRAAARPAVTVQWPHERELPVPGARGSVAATGQPCACDGACVRACPTGCLTSNASDRAVESSAVESLVLDRSACITCGRCIEACPTGALAWSPHDELAALAPEDLVVVLTQPARAPRHDKPRTTRQ